MCGISAVINGTREQSEAMAYAIRRRGITSDTTEHGDLTVSFVHLPIVEDVKQPCVHGNTTVWLNGFISNWKELCSKYRVTFENDTQYLAYHLDNNRPRSELNGFFAVLYYSNGKTQCFTDRYGIKQLYTYQQGHTTFICSEVKGLKAVIDLKIDFDAMEDWEYSLGVMTEHTIYTGVERIICLPTEMPAKLTVDEVSYQEARDRLLLLFGISIRRNRYEGAGCYLSGGVDSGMLAHWMDASYCFSVDYLTELSEIDNIKMNTMGVHYTFIDNHISKCNYPIKTIQALDDLKVGSCYTNFAIAELASRFCKVMYSGAGGDEVFNGYTHRYDRPINDVIRRTDREGKQYHMTHQEYDWRYLRGILVVEDRMSGWHTMETRYPLLDNDFVDYALSLPDEYLNNKRILKDISGLHPNVTSGKKKGFCNPHFTNAEWVKFCKENK